MTNYFNVKLDDILYRKGITLRELSKMTGLKIGVISNIVNNKVSSFNKTHLLKIMYALDIKNLNEIIEIKDYYEGCKPVEIII